MIRITTRSYDSRDADGLMHDGIQYWRASMRRAACLI